MDLTPNILLLTYTLGHIPYPLKFGQTFAYGKPVDSEHEASWTEKGRESSEKIIKIYYKSAP